MSHFEESREEREFRCHEDICGLEGRSEMGGGRAELENPAPAREQASFSVYKHLCLH